MLKKKNLTILVVNYLEHKMINNLYILYKVVKNSVTKIDDRILEVAIIHSVFHTV